ncbi:uncharacterized protein LOC115891247 [Sitophilus oryzae]|uniref:Uncharacterized protein LOC115891247 n=1 Tax=Sitophilus oryzae TaxID=7048 RepID=A0A6J2YXF5_SITOR|nr:uncharacterized protein LOC115891247 [Sitophilus oryzae]
MELFGRFLLQTKEVEETKSFGSRFRGASQGTDLEELFDQFTTIIKRRFQEFNEKDSGWTLQQLLHVDVRVNKINPLKASSYIPLPKEIEAKRAVLNIQNTDQKCFVWSVLAAFHPVPRTQNANRVQNYQSFEQELDVSVETPSDNLKKNKYGENIPENILKFTNFERKLKVPFVVYADFETILEPIQTEQNELDPEISYTVKTHQHVPYSFAYYIKCDFDNSQSIFKTFRGPDAHKVFIDWLETDCKSIYNRFMKNIVSMSPLSSVQEAEFYQMTHCHICERPFNVEDERVRDHCHLTGKYRGAAHSVCNLNFKVPNFIPVFFHNMSNFDSHLFIKELAVEEERLDVIPQNKERYISFTKYIMVGDDNDQEKRQQKIFLKLRFLDSFRFMASSLDKLSQNLTSQQCREVRKYFPNEEEFKVIRMKGVFPYSYVDSFSKLDDTKLPPIDGFYNELRKEAIKQGDYERALNVWNLFKCQTLGEYSDIYLKSDVLLLTDVFENFREVCLQTYGLDPCQYFTAPSLSFDAALKTTSIELKLLTDLDMIHFFKHGIRGGVSQCSVRKAIANNKFMSIYDASKPTSYIMYLDATNLYGAAMSQYLPTGNFTWLTEEEISNLNFMNIDKNSNIGYVFEVDLEYPEHLHDLHNELPFCPESVQPEGSKVSKLIPNFNSKVRYVIHYQNLQQALNHGLKLAKIHRILSFNQSPWLKTYIDLNTAKRNNAENKFEKDFFKLMNNAVFGKTMENVEKRVNIKLVTHWENIGRKLGAEAYISKPHFKDLTIFSENLVAIHMAKQKIVYNKPIYVGFSILEISKTIMYDFLYSYIKPKYGNKASLLYTDTDSLILQIQTDNFYDDMRENLDRFDTSNYSQNNPHDIPVNSSVLGRMKDEYAGKILWEFYGTGG